MNNKGFTLVEIIAVILILGLLVVITTPAYNSISNNIKTRNYNSKKNTIESETLSYVEKYLKGEVYDGTNHNHCFTVGYLIENGIISSDSEKEEYILNDVDDVEYKKDKAYVLVEYVTENNRFKLKAEFKENVKDESTGVFELNKDCPITVPISSYIYKGV